MRDILILVILFPVLAYSQKITDEESLTGSWEGHKILKVYKNDSSDVSRMEGGTSRLINISFDEMGVAYVNGETGEFIVRYDLVENQLLLGEVLYKVIELDNIRMILSRRILVSDHLYYFSKEEDRSN